MIISREQRAFLADRRLDDAVLDYVRQNDAACVDGIPDDVLRARVRMAVARAEELGIPEDARRATLLYAALMFLVGPDFDQHPLCRGVLRDASLPPEARVFALLTKSLAIPWDEVRRACNQAAWGAARG